MSDPIHHTFAPLGTRAQRMDALRMSYGVHRYLRGRSTEIFRKALERHFGAQTALFASGREGLLALLMELHDKPGDEVILQGYTCVVVPNAIQAAGLVPVYVDIDRDTLNLSMEAVEEAITPNTKAIICQHTFGIPADTNALRALCDKHNLVLIEDCAHVIPDDKGPHEIGTLGDAVILSFGRDKAISGITGGAVICRRPALAEAIARKEANAKDLSWWKVARFLEYPQIYAFCRPLYGIGIGKVFLALMGKVHMLIPILTKDEKHSRMSTVLHCMPNACAYVAVRQFAQLQTINDHRRALTAFYLAAMRSSKIVVPSAIGSDLPLQKFPIFTLKAPVIRKKLKEQNIYLDDGWTGCVVCPANVQIEETGYEKGLDPQAEAVCEGILSLPTHPGMTMAQAKRLVMVLQTMMI